MTDLKAHSLLARLAATALAVSPLPASAAPRDDAPSELFAAAKIQACIAKLGRDNRGGKSTAEPDGVSQTELRCSTSPSVTHPADTIVTVGKPEFDAAGNMRVDRGDPVMLDQVSFEVGPNAAAVPPSIRFETKAGGIYAPLATGNSADPVYALPKDGAPGNAHRLAAKKIRPADLKRLKTLTRTIEAIKPIATGLLASGKAPASSQSARLSKPPVP